MPLPIEEYAIIGDTQTAALVGSNGSIDWLCLPRFDSGACFAGLLGEDQHGHWRIAPSGRVRETRRRYRGETLVLETEFHTEDGVVRVVDCMPPRATTPDVVRVVEGVSGRVAMTMELVIRFDYGRTVPWIRRHDGLLVAVAGPDALTLTTPIESAEVDLTTHAPFTVSAGDRMPFVLEWHESHLPSPDPVEAFSALSATERWWRSWSDQCTYAGGWYDAVMRSLLTLKALTYRPTGGIVAAPTTSLPEQLGGVRNWDYRYCWVRDATLTLYALMLAGYDDEAAAWRDWLVRAVAGAGNQLQIMYGVAGERRLPEMELPWLPGYESSSPVRIGNGAVDQYQLDVYGELMDATHVARRSGLPPDEAAWELQRSMMDFLESNWREPDEGIWEVRGPRRDFTHSKMMAWVAADRAVKAVERFGLDGPAEQWRKLRQDIHDEVCREGWDADRETFTQYYGSRELDASMLMMTLVGFLPPTDQRVRGTVAAVERELIDNGFVHRYTQTSNGSVDGLPPGEGAFLACTFWLADNYALMGRTDEARDTFERLLAIRNDVGLLAEEYDAARGRQVGNFPQAFSHVPLVNTARNLSPGQGPSEHRPEHDGDADESGR